MPKIPQPKPYRKLSNKTLDELNASLNRMTEAETEQYPAIAYIFGRVGRERTVKAPAASRIREYKSLEADTPELLGDFERELKNIPIESLSLEKLMDVLRDKANKRGK